jgi:hypothetical protein
MIGHISYPDTLVYKQQWKELQAEVIRDHAIDEYITAPPRQKPGGPRRRVVAALGVLLFLGTLVAVPWLNQRVFIAGAPAGAGVALPAGDPLPEPAAAPGPAERQAGPVAAPVAVEGGAEPAALNAGS